MNAILFAARHGLATGGSVLFTTHTPCLNCAKAIVNAGITEIYAWETYRDEEPIKFLRENNINLHIGALSE